MAGLNMFPPTPLEEDLGFGEQPKSPKRKSTTQAAGLAGLAPSYVDVSALREPQAFAVPELRTPSIAGVSATPSPSPFEAAAPAPTAPVELPPYIAYSPSVKKFFIGGQEVDAQNALEVDRAVSFLDAPSRPAPAKTATDWQPIAKDEFLAFRNALAAPRGFGEKLALGTQEIAASTVGGAGRAVELAGFPETGRAIASFAAEEIGPSTAEQTRSALIAENQGLLANITDAVVQGGLPSIGTTAVAGAAGFAVGGPLGAGIGIIGSIFFPELESSYSAAVQNGYDVNDPQVKAEILTATGAKTAVQSVFPAAIYRGLSRTFTQAAESAVAPAITKALTGRARAGAVTGAAITGGIQEGAAEGLATLVDSVAFDPEFRKMLSVNDWKAIAPYVAEKYGEDLLVSIGAGAFVAGPISAGVKTLETRKPANLLKRPPTEAAPTPAGGLTPEQQQIENLRKTFNVPAPDLFGGFLPTQTPPPDLSRTTTVLPTPPPSPEVQLPFAFGPQPQPPSAPTPAAPTPAAPTPAAPTPAAPTPAAPTPAAPTPAAPTPAAPTPAAPTPAAPTPAAPTPAAPTPAAPTPSAVERVGDNFIRFGTARIEVTDKGIGFQAPGVPSTLFYPDEGVFGDRRGEGRVSQMDERGVPKELQPIFRDYLAGRINKLDFDTIVARLQEVETNFQVPRQGVAAPTPTPAAPTLAPSQPTPPSAALSPAVTPPPAAAQPTPAPTPAPAPQGPVVVYENMGFFGKSEPELTNYAYNLLRAVGLENAKVLFGSLQDTKELAAADPATWAPQLGTDPMLATYIQNLAIREAKRSVPKALQGRATHFTIRGKMQDTFVVRYSKNIARGQQAKLEIIAHEIGHVVEYTAFNNATPVEKDAIRREHLDYLKRTDPKTYREFIESFYPPTLAEINIEGIAPKNLSTEASAILSAYERSFTEWFANQVARWAVSQRTPLTIVERFFKQIGDAYRKLFTQAKASGYVAPNMKAFLDARVPANFTIEEIGLPQFQPKQRPLRAQKAIASAAEIRQVPEGGQPERIGAGPQVQEVREDRNVQPVVTPSGPEAGRGDLAPEGGQVAGAVTPPLNAEAKISTVPYFQQAQQTQPALARVITTDNVRAVGAFDPRYTGYIAGLLKATGLGKRRVIVINADELASIDNLSAPNFNIAASEFNDVKAAINDAKTIFQSGVTKGLAMMTNSGIGIIVRSPSTKGLFGITIAAHEVGHLVKWIAVHSAPWSTQVKLLEAHKKHLDNLLKTNPAGVPPSLKTFVESMRATPQARGETRLAPEFYANTLMTALRISDPAYFNYITGFDEWFADQVARWATTQKRPLTVLEKFFSNLGRRLKALFDAGRKEGLPDPDVKTFLDGLENAPIGASVLIATMQGLPAQTSLTAAAVAAEPTPVGDTRDMPTRIEGFVRRNLSNFPESLQNTASRTAINLYTLGQKGVYGMSFGRDLIDLFAKALPSANAYFDIVVRRATEARILQQEVDKIMERTGGLSLEVRRDLNKFLADSTSKQQWGYQPTWRTDTVQIDPDMAVQYNTLKTKSPEAATVADEIFKYSYQTRNALRNAINTEIEGELTTAQFNKLSPEEQAQRREDAARRLRLLDTTLQNLKGPYAPLSRFGPYAVVAKSKEYLALQKIPYLERSKEERDRLQELKSNPDHYIVQFVSSAGGAQLTKSQLAKQFPSMEVESFERKVLTSELETMPWANLLRLKSVVATQFGVDSKANANQAELINRLLTDMYISALAENSARKHNLPRATVAGFEQDMLKSFVTKGKSDAHFLAAIKTGTDTTEVLEQLGKEAKMSDAEVLEYNKTVPSERQVSGSRLERSQAFNELLLRHVSGMTYNPTPFQDAVLQFNSVWMLLSVPRYYIQNALQTYMVSLPVMAAKFGYGKSSSAITETYQELIKSMDGKWADFLSGKFDVDQMRTKGGKKYPDAELKFLKDMRDSGRIDIGLGYDLGHWESFSETTPIRKLNDTVHKMVALTRQVEIANRITSGMAAYRLAKASGMSEFDARSYAAQVLDQTQGDYSGFNAPRFFSSVPFGKFVFQFRKYQILQLSLLARNTYLMFKGATKEDRRLGRLVLRNVLGQTALATGALGLPITGIAYVLAAAFGEEEEPVDAERFLRSYLTDDYNLADFILKGIPAGLGVDVSAQFGFNTVFSILPYTDVDFTSREGFAKTLLGIGGPVMGTAANVADGFGYFSRGDYQKGFEMMLPNGLKHAMRAYRETFSDGVTRKNGDLVMSPDEFNFMQGILQGLGFSTTEVQRIRRTRQDLYEFETYFSNRTTQIRRDYVEARKSGDVEGMQEAKAAWLALQQSKKRVNFKPSPLLNLYSAPAEQRKREQRYQEQYRGLRE